MKRILISILSILFFTHVSEAQLLPATVKKPTPPAVQKPTSKPVAKPSQKPVVAPKETIDEQKPVVRKKTIALPAGPENFNFNDNYVLFDDFSSNTSGWYLYNTTGLEQKITGGRFVFTNKEEKSSYFTNLYYGLDLSKDFSVSVKLKWQEGINNFGYGINFCSNTSDNSFYLFYISSNGYYKIMYNEHNGSWKDLTAWIASPLVNKGNVSNMIELRKVSRFMEFYINDKLAERLPFDKPFGNDFGFRVDSKQTVEFDDLLIQGKSLSDKVSYVADQDALLEIGEAKIPLRKEVPFNVSMPKNLYDISITNASDADQKIAFKLNVRGKGDQLTKPINFESNSILKELSQRSKFTLHPVMDPVSTLWGFKDSATGKLLVPYQYDWADSMFDGMALVNRGKRFGFINQLGDEAIAVRYDFAQRFQENFARVRINKSYELINRQGIPLQGTVGSNNVNNVNRGVATVSIKEGDKIKFKAINSLGVQIIPPLYNLILPFYEDVSAFSLDTKYGLINIQGKEIVGAKYENILRFTEGYAVARINSKSGYLDKMGNVVIPFQYEKAGVFGYGRAWVQSNGKFSLIDKTGQTVTQATFSAINLFEEEQASVMVGNKWGMVDLNGNWIIAPKYDSLGMYMHEGMIPAKMGTKWGAIDKNANLTVQYKYDDMNEFFMGLASVKLNNKWGFINKYGIEVIPIKFDGAGTFFNGGMAQVKIGSEYVFIDKTGKILSE